MNHLKILAAASLLLFCMAYTDCKAQDDPQEPRVRMGLKGGINLSHLYEKNAENSKMLLGFNAGLFAKLPIVSILSVQPELYVTTKGGAVTYNRSFADGTARFAFGYIEVPVLLVANITPFFNVHAGPYAALLVTGKVKNSSDVSLFDYENNIDIKDYNRIDAGLAIGVGIDVRALSIGMRYSYGFTKVGKERDFLGVSYTFPDAHHGVLSFYLSVSLN